MRERYYSIGRIEKDKAVMNRRAMRQDIKGEQIMIPVSDGTIRALLYRQLNNYPGYLIVEVHGGGFMYNSAADDDDFCDFVNRTAGIPVLACDYRRSPQYGYPTGIKDVYASVNYALKNIGLKIDKDKIILWGHSAGANLAANVAYLAAHRKKEFIPALLILDYPYMDAYKKSHERARIRGSVSGKLMDTFAHYYTDRDLHNPLISPALMPVSKLVKMPPVFLLLCGRDNLNGGGKQYGLKLRAAGVPVTFYYVKQGIHGFIENHFNYSYIPLLTKKQLPPRQRQLAEQAVTDICGWIHRQIVKY